MIRSEPRQRHRRTRFRRTAAAAVTMWSLAGGTIASCEPTPLQNVPFRCTDTCPHGYRCSSGYCIADDARSLPDIAAHSAFAITPVMFPDVDRGGTVTCWTRHEDQNAAQGGIFASFMEANGTVHPTVPLAYFDSRGRDFQVACAPIPRSGGKILIGAWLQQGATAHFRLLVWTPSATNPYDGSSAPFYDETSPRTSILMADTLSGGLRGAVVGDEAWMGWEIQTDTNTIGYPAVAVIRFRVGRAELDAGLPIRTQVNNDGPPDDSMTAQFVGGDHGAWLAFGGFNRFIGYVPRETTGPVMIPLPTPVMTDGFGIPLAATDESLAALWRDSCEPAGTGQHYQIAWLRAGMFQACMGPKLPFLRANTPRPGAMHVGDWLYLFASNHDPTEVPDAGMGDAAPTCPSPTDAGDGASGMDAAPPATGLVHEPLVMYRTHWGCDPTAGLEVVRVIPRDLGDTQVTAAAAHPLPDGTSYGLAWVEYYPPDASGVGARYALFVQRQPL